MTIKIKNSLIKYITYIFALFLFLFIITNIFGTGRVDNKEYVSTSTIKDDGENYSIYVEYPRFDNDDVNSIIMNKIYSYIKEFKNDEDDNKILDVTYELYYLNNEYVNVTFHIENTQSIIKNQNLLIDLKQKKLAYVNSLYDIEYLTNEINNLVFYKYSDEISNEIKKSTVNNFTYIISDDKIDIYFNNINLEKLDEVPYVTIEINEDNFSQVDSDVNLKKYIAFTYDDGPGKYTQELLKVLENNDSSATFFMLGNRMKNYEELVKKIKKSNSEIGSHSYSHKDLTSLSNDELNDELNSTNIIYNAITGENLMYLRPPYNYYNDKIINSGYEVITWNIDTKDWLLKDSTKIYNNVISKACDGCIVLMHDIYEESLEATKKLLPKLKEMGYEVVSISKLAEIKKYDFKQDEVTSSMETSE